MDLSQEIWDNLHAFAKKGAPLTEVAKVKVESGLENKLFHLINLAATFHRDKVSDIKKEIDTFKTENPTWKDSPTGVKLLNDINNICLRND